MSNRPDQCEEGAQASAARKRRGLSDDSEPTGVRVLCVDDHAVLVEGLAAHFAIGGRAGVVGRLASAEGLEAEVERLKPDLVLMDVEMPGPDAFEAADRLRRSHPRVRLLFLTAHIRDGYIAAAYRCGAWGYFAKSDEPDDIAAAVLEIAQSPSPTFLLGPKVKAHCGPALARPTAGGSRRRRAPAGADRDDAAPKTVLESLTDREIEVLRLIGRGRTRTEIAAELCRSVKTIDGHQDRLMRKLGVAARAELMRLAIREGLAEP